MGRVAPGQQNQNFGNDFMKLALAMQQMNYDKERSAYYGAEKEASIANRRAQALERENKQLDTETEREFSQETGLPFKKGVDEPMVAGLRAAKRSEIPPAQPMRREQGPLAKLFSPAPQAPVPTTPYEDPEIAQGRQMGLKAAMVPNLYEQAQKQVQDMGYGDPKSKMYSPEAARLANTRTIRPEDIDKAAKESAITKEHFGKAREQDIKASREQIGLNKDARNAQLMDLYGRTDPADKKTRSEVLRQIAVNLGQPDKVVSMDDTQQKGYLAAVKQSSDATQRLLDAQKANPTAIDVHAGLASEASAGALVAAEISESPMVDLVTAMPYNALNPFSGQYTKSNRVKVPTDYARANRDGVIESMIRAPLNPNDPDDKQIAQMNKQGSYLAWKIIHQNPEYLGNPKAFEAALDKNEAIPPYLKPIAMQHMGLYMQLNKDTRAEQDKLEQDDKQGPPSPEKWGFNLPGGKDPATGEAIPGPRISDKTFTGLLPNAPKGGMFGTKKTVEEYTAEDQRDAETGREAAPRGGSFLEEPATPEQPAMSNMPGPTGPTGPPRGSNLPSITGVPRAGANIPPPQTKLTPAIVEAVIAAESSGNPNAVGKKGEVGLMQLMPRTSEELGLPAGERTDPVKNRETGTRYLNQMVKKFGSVEKALAAYNWGPGNLEKAIAQHGENWMAVIPESTRRYIQKIMAMSK